MLSKLTNRGVIILQNWQNLRIAKKANWQITGPNIFQYRTIYPNISAFVLASTVLSTTVLSSTILTTTILASTYIHCCVCITLTVTITITKETFKIKLDLFLTNIPDQPVCQGLSPEPVSDISCKNSNSIINWVKYLKIGERRTHTDECISTTEKDDYIYTTEKDDYISTTEKDNYI